MEPTFEPREPKSSAGPTVSIVIILMLMIAGAVYFWQEKEVHKTQPLPYIPSSETTTTSTTSSR